MQGSQPEVDSPVPGMARPRVEPSTSDTNPRNSPEASPAGTEPESPTRPSSPPADRHAIALHSNGGHAEVDATPTTLPKSTKDAAQPGAPPPPKTDTYPPAPLTTGDVALPAAPPQAEEQAPLTAVGRAGEGEAVHMHGTSSTMQDRMLTMLGSGASDDEGDASLSGSPAVSPLPPSPHRADVAAGPTAALRAGSLPPTPTETDAAPDTPADSDVTCGSDVPPDAGEVTSVSPAIRIDNKASTKAPSVPVPDVGANAAAAVASEDKPSARVCPACSFLWIQVMHASHFICFRPHCMHANRNIFPVMSIFDL